MPDRITNAIAELDAQRKHTPTPTMFWHRNVPLTDDDRDVLRRAGYVLVGGMQKHRDKWFAMVRRINK